MWYQFLFKTFQVIISRITQKLLTMLLIAYFQRISLQNMQ